MSPTEKSSLYTAVAVRSDPILEVQRFDATSTENALEQLVPHATKWAQEQPRLLDKNSGHVYVTRRPSAVSATKNATCSISYTRSLPSSNTRIPAPLARSTRASRRHSRSRGLESEAI